VLVDGDQVLTESFGINLYLAMRYESELSPRSDEEWAKAFQWTTWVATEVERDLGISIGLRRSGLISKAPDRLREHEAFAQWGARMALRTLENALASDPWLVGGRFTVADLNIASLLALAPPAGISFDDLPRINKWLAECLARPAATSVWGIVLKDAQALGFIGDLDVPEP
jgi:glutathione S-transferase